MTNDEIQREVEQIVRRSEIRAVAEAIRAGRRPQLGDVFDYTIELPPDHDVRFSSNGHKSRDRYQLVVEQWHLDAAYQSAAAAARNRNGHGGKTGP
jgi:hypothetical protein